MSPTQTMKLSKQLTFGEEVANSVTRKPLDAYPAAYHSLL